VDFQHFSFPSIFVMMLLLFHAIWVLIVKAIIKYIVVFNAWISPFFRSRKAWMCLGYSLGLIKITFSFSPSRSNVQNVASGKQFKR
jgi:hypothetical protein